MVLPLRTGALHPFEPIKSGIREEYGRVGLLSVDGPQGINRKEQK
jgi:hypothetical protein